MKIFILDDDRDDVILIGKALKSVDPSISVESVKTLKETLETFHPGQYDVLLLDLNLPDSSGFETLEKVNSLYSKIPVIILTGLDDEKLAREAVSQGAQDYVDKASIFEHKLGAKLLNRMITHAIERHAKMKEIEHLNRRLESLSLLDPLTGLLNQRGLQQIVSREVNLAHRDGTSLEAILMDLDNFRTLNISLGHSVGNIVLKEVAAILKDICRASDYLARLEGDKFMFLMVNTRPIEAIQFSERARLAISENSIVINGKKEIKLTASFGVISVTKKNPSVDQLFEEANQVLTRSKQLGKNCVQGEAPAEEPDLLPMVIESLRNGDKFHSVKQGIFDLHDEKEVGYELLTRSSIRGFEMPKDFYNLSAEANILTSVDHHCLRASVEASFAIPPALHRHVNLFPSTIIGLPVDHLVKLFPPLHLAGTYCIEISEQQILGNPAYLMESVQALKKIGVQIAIDDVGFGRSCLESLIVLQPDMIKIDKKLVMGVSHDESKRESLKRLLNIATSLNTDVIAEGIENREDLEVLKSLGVKYGQGFLWGVPA